MNYIRRLVVSSALVAIALTASAAPTAAQDDRLEGVYATDALRMVVVATEVGRYAGRFEIAEEQVPFEAQSVVASLGMQGRTLLPGSETDFEALMVGGLMVVGDGTQTFFLRRISESVEEDLSAEVLSAVRYAGIQAAGAAEPEASETPMPPAPTYANGGGAGLASEAVSAWTDKLWNARLTYMYSYYSGGLDGAYVGASEETTIDICGRGFFRYGSTGFLSADGGGGSSYNVAGGQSSGEQGSGAWRIVGRGADAALRLEFNDGSVNEYVLSTDEDGKGTYLNGRRYYRTYAHSPIEEYRPTCPA